MESRNMLINYTPVFVVAHKIAVHNLELIKQYIRKWKGKWKDDEPRMLCISSPLDSLHILLWKEIGGFLCFIVKRWICWGGSCCAQKSTLVAIGISFYKPLSLSTFRIHFLEGSSSRSYSTKPQSLILCALHLDVLVRKGTTIHVVLGTLEGYASECVILLIFF